MHELWKIKEVIRRDAKGEHDRFSSAHTSIVVENKQKTLAKVITIVDQRDTNMIVKGGFVMWHGAILQYRLNPQDQTRAYIISGLVKDHKPKDGFSMISTKTNGTLTYVKPKEVTEHGRKYLTLDQLKGSK